MNISAFEQDKFDRKIYDNIECIYDSARYCVERIEDFFPFNAFFLVNDVIYEYIDEEICGIRNDINSCVNL